MTERTQAYGLLFLVIFISLCFQLAAPSAPWARIVTIVLQGGALLLALYVSRVKLLLNSWAASVVVAATVTGVVVVLLVNRDAEAPGHAIALAFLVFAIVAIALGVVAEARGSGSVNLRTVAGGLCIYLLLGMTFSMTSQLVADLSSEQFFSQVAHPSPNQFLYFSFVTLTTTGFGDLTAATSVGRSITVAEALIGQIYLVTVVALIVANLGRGRAQAA